MLLQRAVPLAPLSSFKIGGFAQYFFAVSQVEDLLAALTFAQEKKLPYHLIAGMTNVLLPDHDLPCVIQLVSNQQVDLLPVMESGTKPPILRLPVWAGEKVANLAWQSLRAGYQGLENFASLPGTVGGAIWNNAHYGSSFIADHLLEVTFFDLKTQKMITKNKNDLAFAYDQSWFHQHSTVIVEAVFELVLSDQPQLIINQALVAAAKRRHSQPLSLPSAGCFWQNYPNNDHLRQLFPEFAGQTHLSAGLLIDRVGLKGHQVGQAQVSPVHAAFIVNLGGATSQEVRTLATFIQATIKQQFDLELKPEVVMID